MSANLEYLVDDDRVKYRWDAIIDVMLSNPTLSQNEIAEMLGYTPAYLSTLKKTDGFQVRYYTRRRQMSESIQDRVQMLMMLQIEKASEAILDGIEAIGEEDGPTHEFALSAQDKALRGLGFGPSSGPSSISVNTNVSTSLPSNSVADNVIEDARKIMIDIAERNAHSLLEKQKEEKVAARNKELGAVEGDFVVLPDAD